MLWISVNLKLTKDTQLVLLLTRLFTFPSAIFPTPSSICPSVFPQLENRSRWAYSVPPDARWSNDRRKEGRVEGALDEKPKSAPVVTTQQHSLLWPVIRQRWPFPALPWKIMCTFPDLWPRSQWMTEKSPDVFLHMSFFFNLLTMLNLILSESLEAVHKKKGQLLLKASAQKIKNFFYGALPRLVL